MRSLATLSFVLALAALAHADPEPIIGGTATTVGQYPTVVGVLIGNNALCTGELITKDWVVTAGHCVDPDPNATGLPNQAAVTAAITVVFDSVDVLGTGGTRIKASDTIMDPMFNINNLGSHDMGLIKLVTPYTATPPSPINLDAAKAPLGTVVTQVGFGTTSGTNPNAGAGVEFELKNRTVVSCATIPQTGFTAADDANLLCFSQADGKGKCEGDSGGPTFAMIGGALTIIGTTSFGDMTCQAFGADTRTDAEKAFLLAHIPELDTACTMDSDCKTANQICFQSACIDEPFSPMGLGTDCTAGTQCQSTSCGTGPGGMKCTTSCTVGAANACPSGFDCLGATGAAAGAQGDCWPSGSGSGCCDASGRGAPTSLLGLGLVALVLRRRRRRA